MIYDAIRKAVEKSAQANGVKGYIAEERALGEVKRLVDQRLKELRPEAAPQEQGRDVRR